MRTVQVSLGSRSYDITISEDLLDNAGTALAPYLRGKAPVVITDENVAVCQLPRLRSAFDGGIREIILPAGEVSKSWAQLAALTNQLLEMGVERSDEIIALGGGVIGDLVGFAASILKRGCNFIQIPTSLLAQVDSSVGGKTAINVTAGKNLIGAFYQPVHVLIDPSVLDTLPERHLRAGYAEIVKYGLLGDLGFFEWCEANGKRVITGDRGAQIFAIETSVRSKAAIVAADERETGDKRALLNLGHTFAHALEAEMGFSDKLLHGEAVAAGMALAFAYSARIGLCSSQDVQRVTGHLAQIGLPTGLTDAGVKTNGAQLVEHMLHDKKMSGGTLPFILARGIGQAFVNRDVVLADVAAFLDESRG